MTRPAASNPARRALLAGACCVLLAACAAPRGDEGNSPPRLESAERVARVLAGRYAGYSTGPDAGEESAGELVRLDTRIDRVGADAIELTMRQRTGESGPRHFELVLEPTTVATRLEGSFSPLGPDGRRLGSCPIEVSVQSDGFVARTDPATCRFGEGGAASALIKEIAHDGQRLVIGDRVVDPDTGESRMADRVLQLDRVRSYAGWAGVRDGPGSAWRIADAIELESDGRMVDPEDAAGMSLGISLELGPHRVRSDEAPVLRLRAFDRETGELLGQAWADPQATRVGLGLPEIQVGLRLRRE